MTVARVTDVATVEARIMAEMERVVVGKRAPLELILIGILANGHILIEDYPGLAKTLIARSFAQVTDMDFRRVQFTPDLMPSDITGSSIYDRRRRDFEFRSGPIFTKLLLGDEINRAPPKTQAALLEGMAERRVTVDGQTHPLPSPFIVIATQNPIEYEGTYPLPEAQLDRFLLRVEVGYPSHDDETDILRRRVERRSDSVQLSRMIDRVMLLELQGAVEEVHVDPSIASYIVDLVGATRAKPAVQVGASPRGSLAVLAASRAHAALLGRDVVIPEDVKAVTVAALGHRLTLEPDLWVRGSGETPSSASASTPSPPRPPLRGTAAVTRIPTPRVVAYPLISSVLLLLLAALTIGRPELAAVAAPFTAVLSVGILLSRAPGAPLMSAGAHPTRIVEGQTFTLTVDVALPRAVDGLEIGVPVRRGLELTGANPRLIVREDGAERRITIGVRSHRGGAYALGALPVRAHDPLHVYRFESRLESDVVIRVYPRTERLRSLMRPAPTQACTGNRAARRAGEGIEFADIRPFVSGDRTKAINWRSSARRGGL